MHVARAQNPVNLRPVATVIEGVSIQPASPTGRRRWLICALLFFATSVNYMNRQVIGLLKPTRQLPGISDRILFRTTAGAEVTTGGSLIRVLRKRRIKDGAPNLTLSIHSVESARRAL